MSAFFNSNEREKRVRSRTRGSEQRFLRAQKSLAGGVASGMRRSVRPYPLYYSYGRGSSVEDVDGNRYIDYGLAWGPLILGHLPSGVTKAISDQLTKGLTFGAQHDLEFEVSELMKDLIPCADLVCFANSGTEIVQVAIRLARAYTGRKCFVKFEGHYHGWMDNVLVSYHPTQTEIAAVKGGPVPVGAGQNTDGNVLIAEWNNRQSITDLFAGHGGEISSVICEPMLCNSGCIPPQPGFLEFLRDITQAHGALLIFDEVITGFRLDLAGAQGFYDVMPDLATYAKALGSGVAVSALAGKELFMQWIAMGKVVHAGTMNGNGIALAGASATLEALRREGKEGYQKLHERGERLRRGIESELREQRHTVVTSGHGAVFQILFIDSAPSNYRETIGADMGRYGDLALALLDEGILVLPDGRWYISFAHTDDDIEATLIAVHRAVL